jgi:glycosyltransferase involved in cell wall biosynthesis
MHKPTVSIIIATHNRREMLNDLLKSISKSSILPDEIVITDDASTPAFKIELDLGLNIKLLRNENCFGPGKSRNIAVHNSIGDILLFTDDDCLITENWIREMVQGLINGQQGGLGGCGGAVKANGSDIFSRYYDFHHILEPRPHDRENPKRIPYLVTANCGVWRYAFMRAGGFDERIPTAGGEDAAFSMRMAKMGYYFEFIPKAEIIHRYRVGLGDFCKTFYRYGLGGRYVVDRYLSS